MKILVFLTIFLCFVGHVFAIDFEIKEMKEFIIITQKDGTSFFEAWAIKKPIISGVSIEQTAGNYRIIIATSIKISDTGTISSKEYATKTSTQQEIQSAFNSIMKILTKEESVDDMKTKD